MAADTATATAPTEQAPAAPVAASPEPRAPAKDAAAPAEKTKKANKPEKPKKGSKSSKAKGAVPASDGPSVAAHPRAVRAVARAKSWGGLIGFMLGGYLSLPTNTLADTALRALLAGVACYVAAWAGAVFLWRRLVMLEIKGREQQLLAASQQAARALSAGRESPAASVDRPRTRAAS